MINLIDMGKKGIYWLLLSTGLLLAILSIYTGLRFKSLGAFVEVKDSFEGIYTVVAEVPGPEALQLDRETGTLYFISNNPCAGQKPRGSIYYLKLDSPNAIAHPLKFDHPKDFHPHGLSFFRDKQKKKYLFTNNHRDDGSHTVEIFSITAGDNLEHQITISGNELTSPNDLVAVGPRQFYVTNDGRSHDCRIRSIDTFLARKTGNVLYYDGREFIEVVDNLHFPNGIAFDIKTSSLIVGETLSGNIIIYRLDDNNIIQSVDNFFIGTGIDNLSLEEAGSILVAVHPNLWALSQHMKSIDKQSPSQVFRVNYQTKGLKLLYQHDGSIISAVSTAVSYKDNLFLGVVCDKKLLKLKINNDP